MFFDPPPAGEEPAPSPQPKLPDWMAPPAQEMGATLVTGLTLARSPNVVMALPAIHAYSTGCLMTVEVAIRQGDLSPDAFWDLHMSAHPIASVMRGGGRLPGRLVRFGVRFRDGTKAATYGSSDPPSGPLLGRQPAGGGLRSGANFVIHNANLWLWPLPPAETFELGVAWPLAGIDLSIVELDGSVIVSTARNSALYWPDLPQSD
jgi:hypothetical protein